MPERRPRRQPWLVPTVVVFVVLPIGAAIATAITSGDDGDGDGDPTKAISRAGSELLAEPGEGEPMRFGNAPLSYRLTYRSDRFDADGRTISSTEEIEVRRPFEGRTRVARGAETISERVSRFGSFVLGTAGAPRRLAASPAPAASDLRADVVVEEAAARHIASVREQRRVLGRRCQVYRFGSTLAAAEVVPVGAKGAGEYADACVDEQGFVLEEVWVTAGKAVRRRLVTRLDLDTNPPDDRFTLPGEVEVPFDEGNGFVKAVVPGTSLEGEVWVLDEASAPEGFGYLGRWAVQPPRLELFRDPLSSDQPRGSIVQADVWVRGPDLLVVTTTLPADASGLPGDPPNVETVDLGELGRGAAVLDLRGNYVRIDFPDARFLRVTGTLPLDELVDIARKLRRTQGTGVQLQP